MLAAAYIPNGRSKGRRPSDFDPTQLQVGTKVEMEHTTDRRVAQRIAKIHLDGGRRRHAFGAAACSTSPRWVRGGVGFLIGTLLGGMVGGGIATAVITFRSDITEPVASINRIKTMTLVASGVTVMGALGGLALGASKPEC